VKKVEDKKKKEKKELPKLTDTWLRSLKPQKKRYKPLFRDNPGLVISVANTGKITFSYRYQIKGVRREMKLGDYPVRTMQNLMVEYAKQVDLVQQEIDPLQKREAEAQKEEDNPLFRDFAERFIEQHCKKKLAPSSAYEYERMIRKHFIPAWGKIKVVDIKRKQVVRLIEKMSNKAPIQANRALAIIKKILNYALDVGVIEINPATRIKPPGKERPRNRVLDMPELVTLFNTLDGLDPITGRDIGDILKLIVLTAQRPGEIVEMRISQLKEDSGGLWFEIEAADTKNREPQRIFLNNMAAEIINQRISDLKLKKYIFPAGGKSGVMRKDVLVNKTARLQPLMQEQGIEHFTAHDLRRSAATGLARLGYGAIIDDILNHKQRGITRRVYDLYNRAPEIQHALTSWGEAIERALSGVSATVIPITQIN